MIEARRQFSIMGPLGWTIARCLSYSWTKLRRQAEQKGDRIQSSSA
jgi:hypothetical protein